MLLEEGEVSDEIWVEEVGFDLGGDAVGDGADEEWDGGVFDAWEGSVSLCLYFVPKSKGEEGTYCVRLD